MSKGSIRRQKRRMGRREGRREDRDLQRQLTGEYGRGGMRLFNSAKKWLKFSKTPPTAFDDIDVYGTPLPLSFGTFRHACAIIWTTKLTPIIQDPSEPYSEQYKASFAAKICEGQQGSLLRVWFNKVLVLDRTTVSGDRYSSAPDYSGKISFYPGSTTQTASPVIETEEGAGFVPAYRDTCYLVCKDIPMGRFGNALPEIEVEVAAAATPDYTTYDVAAFSAPATANIQQWFVTRNTPFIYQYDGGNLFTIRKNVPSIRRTIDVQAALDSIAAGCSVTGRFTVDEGSGAADTIYLLCEDSGGAAFVLRYDGAFASNYADRVTGAAFDTCFVYNGRLLIADGTAGKVYSYDKSTLTRQWIATAPTAGYEAGNFTYDKRGFIWLVWYNAADINTLHLTRLRPGGALRHFTLSDYSGHRARCIAYDYTNDVIIAGGVTGDPISIAILSTAGVPSYNDSGVDGATRSIPMWVAQHRFSRTFYNTDGTNLYKIKVADWNTAETIALSNFADTGTGTEAYAYDYLSRALWICRDASPGMSKLPLNRDSGADADLDDVASSLLTESGLVAGDIDVTEATAHPVTGYTIQDQTTARDPLTQLLTAYQFGVREHFESGYAQIKLELIDRATQGASFAIAEDEVGIGDGAAQEPVFGEEKVQEEDLPFRVRVRYADTRRNYTAHSQASEVPLAVTSATEELSLEFPNLVLSDDNAKQLADKILSSGWSEGERRIFTLPLWFLGIEPEDVVGVTLDGISYSLRIESVELGSNLLLEVSAVLALVDQYTSASTGDTSTLNDRAPEVLTPTSLWFVDCPAVRDADGVSTDAGFYLFAAPQDTDANWPGCRVYRSLDGQLYTPVTTISNAATIGAVTAALNDGDAYTFDSASEVTILITSGSLTTQTEAALVADPLLNLAAIGTETGGWELVQFATVTANGSGSYTLTGMRRGRFGTEHLTATHAIGEAFLLFDFTTPTTQRLSLALYDRGEERYYKGVTVGTSQTAVEARAFTCQAKGLMPWTVSNVVGVLSGGVWTINFSRRSRIGGELSDYSDAPLNEATEEYELDIRDNPSTDVFRTLTIGPGLPVVSGVNLSADAATQKFARVSGDFTLEFFVGQRIETAGFTNAGNNGRWTISVVTALDVTVTAGATTMVTEASASGRTLTAVTPAVQYTAAQQLADGGAKSTFYLEVYQISDRLREQDEIGRGFTDMLQIL